jgi:hypothetical protein
MFKLEPSPPEQSFGCLLLLLGGMGGACYGLHQSSLAAAQYELENPGQTVCGMHAFAYAGPCAFAGGLGGGVLGSLLGLAYQYRTRQANRKGTSVAVGPVCREDSGTPFVAPGSVGKTGPASSVSDSS